jgi:predicted metal-binding protein
MQSKIESFLDTLKKSAFYLGATDARIIPATLIPIEDQILELCRNPICENYRNCANCPPLVMHPRQFRDLVSRFERALIFKLDVSPKVLLSEACTEVFKRIYEMTIHLEDLAVKAGYTGSKGYAASSCKSVFCKDVQCQALKEGTPCRYPSLVRPSIQAVGVNVFKLVEEIGWKIYPITKDIDPSDVPSGMVAGLVLAGG